MPQVVDQLNRRYGVTRASRQCSRARDWLTPAYPRLRPSRRRRRSQPMRSSTVSSRMVKTYGAAPAGDVRRFAGRRRCATAASATGPAARLDRLDLASSLSGAEGRELVRVAVSDELPDRPPVLEGRHAIHVAIAVHAGGGVRRHRREITRAAAHPLGLEFACDEERRDAEDRYSPSTPPRRQLPLRRTAPLHPRAACCECAFR